ncbi:MAG TPA: SpoIIE family protein phosphatase [Ktedonobacterales bacterium]|jgi:serine phosphatase RsbU (regulator of sigma subunit)/anti-sigma regulatory factor (Ser/Thr protein kinase)
MAKRLNTFRQKRLEGEKQALQQVPPLAELLAEAAAQNGLSLQLTHAPAPALIGQRDPSPTVEIAPNDPIVAYFLSAPGVVEIDKLHLDSPTLRALKAAKVKLAIPLISQGELIGVLNLGQRLSEQDYSAYDRKLLSDLATQAAPAVRVAQLVREQQAAIQERERIEQELQVARLIQQTLLPRELPELPGWQVAAYYQPARAVGGDFYDFFYFEDGRLGVVIGDVTDKGIPAALVMATTRSILRSAAQRLVSPGRALEHANDLLCPDIPARMFVTCLYAILDPATGLLQYANAGHDLPYRRRGGEVSELRATGMPLGLMPGMGYEEKVTFLEPGDSVLLYSDGLAEAHNPQREMFGFPRLMALLSQINDNKVIDSLLSELASFTGPDWEQEDDVTLVTLRRAPQPAPNIIDDEVTLVQPPEHSASSVPVPAPEGHAGQNAPNSWRSLAELAVPSAPGNERQAMEQVAEAVQPLGLEARQLEQLKTAVAEATMNAMEHGNRYQPDVPVLIRVLASETTLSVRITDQGGGETLPEAETPDLEAKLAELQSPRGWGLFLIKNLVDDMRVTSDATSHTIELILGLEGATHVE